jgi:hypothetical protein
MPANRTVIVVIVDGRLDAQTLQQTLNQSFQLSAGGEAPDEARRAPTQVAERIRITVEPRENFQEVSDPQIARK